MLSQNNSYKKGVSVSDHYTIHQTTIRQDSLISVWDDDSKEILTEEHVLVKNSNYDADDTVKDSAKMERETEACNEDEGGQFDSIKRNKLFCLTMSSNVWFLIGSVFYVWLAAIDLQWEKAIVGIPGWVLVADDDYSWEGYDYGGDDYIFQAGNSWVSQAQIVYTIAALSFVITGMTMRLSELAYS
jgi:hypothetical protein